MTPVTTDQSDNDDTAQIELVSSVDTDALLHQATGLLSEGRSGEAVDLCQQIIRQGPATADVYVLLGMAHEEQDNLHLALDAYRQALSLAPERTAQREKITLLAERIAEQDRAAQAARPRLERLARAAPLVLGIAVAFLVLVGVAAALIQVRKARGAAEQQHAYQAAMQRGQALLAEQRYEEAGAAFRQAEQIRPTDPDARHSQRQAATLARQQAQYSEYMLQSGGGKVSLESAINPFQPVPIGPQPSDSQQPTSPARQAARASSAPLPSPEWELPSPTISQGEGPLQAPRDTPSDAVGPPSTEMRHPSGGPVAPQKPAGKITIQVNEPLGGAAGTASGDGLRAAADELRRAGHYQQAIEQYQQAQRQYRRESQQDTVTTSVKQSAIQSCQRAIETCRSQLGE